jgi:hypothetical protein
MGCRLDRGSEGMLSATVGREDIADAAVFLGIFAGNYSRSIRGAIIPNNEMPMGIGLGELEPLQGGSRGCRRSWPMKSGWASIHTLQDLANS